MATAVDTYTWALKGDALKAYLGIVGVAEDANLATWLASAAADCDDFCGELAAIHSPKLWLGICEWVRAMRAWVQSPAGLGLASVSTGALSETYTRNLGPILARRAATGLWWSSVADVSLGKPYNEPFGI